MGKMAGAEWICCLGGKVRVTELEFGRGGDFTIARSGTGDLGTRR